MSALREIIEAAKIETGLGLSGLTALSPQNDPYRLDTPANHAVGQWFREQMERLNLLHRRLHLRGIHYALLGSTTMPSGEPYINIGECWDWLQTEAAKAARWLGYVQFDAITDARNAAPLILVQPHRAPDAWISADPEILLPTVDDLEPRVVVSDFEGRQAVRLAIYGEKSSLEPVLRPIAERFGADLYLPTGEISDTQLHVMAKNAADDGRPFVLFTVADFDPAGNQMAVSIGRKLQAFRDLMFPELDFEVRPIALTADQVRELGLPSSPLKATERRADRWREEHGGLEQTEVDALATLRPEILRRIVNQAVEPFYDDTLSHRVWRAKADWQDRAETALAEQLGDDARATIHGRLSGRIAAIRQQLREIEAEARVAVEDLDVELPPIVVPEAYPPGSEGKPLISSGWSWAEQTAALIARKRYGNGSVR